MLVFRFEKEDGSGPIFNKDSTINDNYLSGCSSLQSLYSYFKERDVSLDDCHLVIYNIPDDHIVKTKFHILFPKEDRSLKLK